MIGTIGSGRWYQLRDEYPCAGVAEMLLHINGTFTMGTLKSSLLSFLAGPHGQFRGVSMVSFFQAQWDRCYQQNHKTKSYLVKLHHSYSGT